MTGAGISAREGRANLASLRTNISGVLYYCLLNLLFSTVASWVPWLGQWTTKMDHMGVMLTVNSATACNYLGGSLQPISKTTVALRD